MLLLEPIPADGDVDPSEVLLVADGQNLDDFEGVFSCVFHVAAQSLFGINSLVLFDF